MIKWNKHRKYGLLLNRTVQLVFLYFLTKLTYASNFNQTLINLISQSNFCLWFESISVGSLYSKSFPLGSLLKLIIDLCRILHAFNNKNNNFWIKNTYLIKIICCSVFEIVFLCFHLYKFKSTTVIQQLFLRWLFENRTTMLCCYSS